MFGGITQISTRLDYIAGLQETYDQRRWIGGDVIGQYSLQPGMSLLVLHRLRTGVTQSDRLTWGYRSPAAIARGQGKRPDAKIEVAPASRPWATKRVLVPVDGWYEWAESSAQGHLWYVRLATDQPIFLAAITNYVPGENEGDPELGVAIVTTAADGGLKAIHSRRPVVLGPQEAQRWLDDTLQPVDAVDLAKNRLRPSNDFEWHEVNTALDRTVPMGSLTIEQARELIAPLKQ